MMTATKKWVCDCHLPECTGIIKPGEKFNIKGGTFYKEGHDPEDRKKIKISVKPKIILRLKKA